MELRSTQQEWRSLNNILAKSSQVSQPRSTNAAEIKANYPHNGLKVRSLKVKQIQPQGNLNSSGQSTQVWDHWCKTFCVKNEVFSTPLFVLVWIIHIQKSFQNPPINDF